ncbi:MAG: 4Fe-4S dicluster domain-containing protein [bacterium]
MPAIAKEQVHWQRLSPEATESADAIGAALKRIRAAEPVKTFLFSPREKVAELPGRFEPGPAERRILFGAKACDVAALRVHRKMYLEQEHKDDFYRSRRENTLIVVADCPAPEDSCFCNLVHGRPYATGEDRDEADVAFSVLEDGWLLEPLTEAGEKLVVLARTTPATEAQLASRESSRKAAGKRLAEINPKPFAPDTPARIWKRVQDNAFWSGHAADCVECYGCLMACPTCYCFLLHDKAKAQGMERTKVWDACYVAAYARVGGGANPRAEFIKRFYNRFYCKFSHFPNWQGMPACSGCGRCYKVCMGKIDIRKVLLEV